jgi:hypothetical protein
MVLSCSKLDGCGVDCVDLQVARRLDSCAPNAAFPRSIYKNCGREQCLFVVDWKGESTAMPLLSRTAQRPSNMTYSRKADGCRWKSWWLAEVGLNCCGQTPDPFQRATTIIRSEKAHRETKDMLVVTIHTEARSRHGAFQS